MSNHSKPSPNGERERLLQSNSNQGHQVSRSTSPVPEETDNNAQTLAMAFFAMLVMQLGNRIFGKLMTYPLHNYALFTSVLSTFIYIPISFIYIIPVQVLTDWISKEQCDIPKHKFAVMGLFDTIAGTMSSFAVNYIANASMIVLVQQSAIPISMGISQYLLDATYTKAQYTGAGVVLLGIAVVLIPSFFAAVPEVAAVADPTVVISSNDNSDMLWITLLVLSCIPMCLSTVYKEKALGEVEIDVVYLNGWVALYQSLFAIPLLWPSAFLIGLPYDQIGSNLYGGFLCWMGINSIMPGNDLGLPPDHCEMGPIYMNTYIVFNVVYNLLIVVILKHGSANIMWMASTVIVPLSNVAFSMPWMPNSQPMKVWDFIGLCVIMFGLVIYRFTEVLLSLWNQYTGSTSSEELAEKKLDKVLQFKILRKAMRFIGFNQMESLNAVVDTRISNERKKMRPRSPTQIRNNLLIKLGLPASPLISAGARSRGASPAFGSGPQLERRFSESWDKIKKRSSLDGMQIAPRESSTNVPRNSSLGAPGYGSTNSIPNAPVNQGIAMTNMNSSSSLDV